MADLAEKLKELGYVFISNSKFATPELRLELALREFQTYAKLPVAAQLADAGKPYYAERLKSVDLPPEHRLLTEGVTGAQTPRTLELIDIWIDKKYRCPVVVECWRAQRTNLKDGTKWWTRRMDGKVPAPKPDGENIWLWDDPKEFNAALRGRKMFVRDFTKRFDDHPVFKRLVEDATWPRLLLGSQNGTLPQDGPFSDKTSQQVAIKVTPLSLTGKNYLDLTDIKTKITYRVVRAVSEAECQGYFDTVNCWDKALLSIGLCHWTIAHPDSGPLALGELEAMLAYAKKLDPKTLKAVTGDTGVEPSLPWYNGDKKILNKDTRKYETQFSQLVLVNKDGKLVEYLQPVPFDRNRYNFFRSWHWFYRVQMACRTSPEIQKVMWDMARFRLRDIITAPVGIDGIKNGAGAPARIGDVFTSEQSLVWLMEWHVYLPSHVFEGGQATAELKKIIKQSGVDLTKPTDKWDPDDELKLVHSFEILDEELKRRFKLAMACGQLAQCPHPDPAIKNPKALSAARNSFKLDDTDLGPTPF